MNSGKRIWFEGERLPRRAPGLDEAARLCAVSEETRAWFARLAAGPGVDDARTVAAEAEALQTALRTGKDGILRELERTQGEGQAAGILAAWVYALETILQQAAGKATCSWKVEGADEAGPDEFDNGDTTLRRV